MSGVAVECQSLKFAYPVGSFHLHVPFFCVQPKETVFLYGPSGSGKSTLLNLLGGVLKAGSGEVSLMGTSFTRIRGSECDQLRVDHMGFLFQQFNLLNYLSVLGNVMLPCEFSKVRRGKAILSHGSVLACARYLLNSLGLDAFLDRRVSDLSVGQQQRVAAARALIGSPSVIVADEPTSALDAEYQQRFIDVLQRQIVASDSCLLFVSHDQRLATHFQRHQSILEWVTGAALD